MIVMRSTVLFNNPKLNSVEEHSPFKILIYFYHINILTITLSTITHITYYINFLHINCLGLFGLETYSATKTNYVNLCI